MKHFLFYPIVLIFLLVGHPIYAQREHPLNQAQVVEIAEEFVSRNRFTNGTRSNPIMPSAIIAFIKKMDGESFWSVQFLFRNQQPHRHYDFGREVRVSLDGNRVWMGRKPIQMRRVRIMGDCLGDEKETAQP